MSVLTCDRSAADATRLGLTHLVDTIAELLARAEAGQMGYLDFVDLLLGLAGAALCVQRDSPTAR